MPRAPRPLVDAIFISTPDRFEVGPADHFEVGQVYKMQRASLDRWIGLGRARAATPEEVEAADAPVEATPTVAPSGLEDSPAAPADLAPSLPAPTTPVDVGGDAVEMQESAGQAAAAELLAAIDADPRMNFMVFSSKAKEILGDDMPAKKVEIIAALKVLAAPPETAPAG